MSPSATAAAHTNHGDEKPISSDEGGRWHMHKIIDQITISDLQINLIYARKFKTINLVVVCDPEALDSKV